MKNYIRKNTSVWLAMVWLLFGCALQTAMGQDIDDPFEDVDKIEKVKDQLMPEEIRILEDYARDIKEFNENLFERQLDAYERFKNTTVFKPEKSALEASIGKEIAKGILGFTTDLLGDKLPGIGAVIGTIVGIGEELERAEKARGKNNALNWVEALQTKVVHLSTESFTNTLRDSLFVEAVRLEPTDQDRGKFLSEIKRFKRNKKRWLPRVEELEYELYVDYLHTLFKANPKKGGYVMMVFNYDYEKTKKAVRTRLVGPRSENIAAALNKLRTIEHSDRSQSQFSSVLDIGIPIVVAYGYHAVSRERGHKFNIYDSFEGKPSYKDYASYYTDFGIVFPSGKYHAKSSSVEKVIQFLKNHKESFYHLTG